MKRLITIMSAVAALLAVASCGNKTKKVLMPNISGKAGEVIVVIEKNEWNGAVGTALRETL